MGFALVAFFPGLALGSFLNVVAARVPLRRSIVRPASACMSCATPIERQDNIPLYSYLRLRGRCRACGARIPFRYPAVELATALLLAGCVVRFGLSLDALVAAFVCAVLVAISATDLEHRIVPNRIVVPAAAVVLVAGHAILDAYPSSQRWRRDFGVRHVPDTEGGQFSHDRSAALPLRQPDRAFRCLARAWHRRGCQGHGRKCR